MPDLEITNDSPVYVTCNFCQEGKIELRNHPATDFAKHHAPHGSIEIVPEAIFRSDHLTRSYIDVDRPDLEPIVLGFNSPSPATRAPFGVPGDKEKSMAIAREARRAFAAALPPLQPGDLDEEEPVIELAAPAIVQPSARPSWDQTWLEVAFVMAKRGTCSRKQVGAVIVKDNRIVQSGYNGAPRGLDHCHHHDYPYTNSFGKVFEDPHLRDGHCVNAEHAERNALIFGGREAFGATLYLTCSPCLPCARMAVTAGIVRIVYAEDYRPEKSVNELCSSAGIIFERIALVNAQIRA